jgi:maleate isomerase
VVATDDDQRAVRAAMVAGLGAALDTLAPARPDHAILAVMVEHFAGGGAAGERLVAEAEARLGCPVTVTTEALLAALAALGVQRVALLSPFLAEGHAKAVRFLEEAGVAVVRSEALAVPGPAAIAHVPEGRLRAALRALDAPEVEAIVQVGTNLPFARLAVEAEAALGKPVLAANPTVYWRALRRAGITARREGAGVLFARA